MRLINATTGEVSRQSPSMNALLMTIGFLCMLTLSSGISHATPYSFAELNLPPTGLTFAYDINDMDAIVGESGTGDGFLLTGGSLTALSAPWSSRTVATGINDVGQIVGFTEGNTPGSHGFSYFGGAYTQLDVPGATSTLALGINNRGEIVGAYRDTSGLHGFLYSSGVFSTIDAPGAGGQTLARGINEAGTIAGEFDATHGFLYSAGTFLQLDVPGATVTRAFGIDNRDQVVGLYEDGSGRTYGFLYSGGTYETIRYPDSGRTVAAGINDSGLIVGLAGNSGFVATPIPEPEMYALILLGLGLLALNQGRRKPMVA